jgi:hypothetical protein
MKARMNAIRIDSIVSLTLLSRCWIRGSTGAGAVLPSPSLGSVVSIHARILGNRPTGHNRATVSELPAAAHFGSVAAS